ncbi:hypothetical protein AGLY_013566 [Aphis glycines]|uniref:Uncharacterized protein n=1 Tax=Aphis glycines TaxID=307491 RepID=A0A6G0T6N8_APHGL|nr:hypothetical protein AGLY_013566 [Aphis glycines]
MPIHVLSIFYCAIPTVQYIVTKTFQGSFKSTCNVALFVAFALPLTSMVPLMSKFYNITCLFHKHKCNETDSTDLKFFIIFIPKSTKRIKWTMFLNKVRQMNKVMDIHPSKKNLKIHQLKMAFQTHEIYQSKEFSLKFVHLWEHLSLRFELNLISKVITILIINIVITICLSEACDTLVSSVELRFDIMTLAFSNI